MAEPSVVHPGRRSSATTAANSERRAEIRAIAAEIFARKGFQQTTVREIADASGILSGSLYHHFESKEAILDEILTDLVYAMVDDFARIAEAGDDPITTLRNLIRHQFRVLVENRAAITTATNDSYYLRRLPRFAHLDATNVAIADSWTSTLRRGIDDGSQRPGLDPQLLWAFIRGAVWGTVQMQARRRPETTDELADAYLETLLGGIQA
jgi:AcrR family transcriptional regulator